MIKTRDITLAGRDAGLRLRLTELAALDADRRARRLLADIDADIDGGIVSLAYQHLQDVRALGESASGALMGFVRAQMLDEHGAPTGPLDPRRHLRDWRNVERMQNAALLLHVDFMVGRKQMEIPVRMQAQSLLAGADVARVTYCSPVLSAVINSRYATYVELETVLGTEDAYNLAESINADSLREWMQAQASGVRGKL